MKRPLDISERELVSEMAIVDTFTKLIFGEETEYSDCELRIIQVLRSVDDNVSLDSHRDMGIYLCALGVREMIGLVSRVRTAMVQGVHRESAPRTISTGDNHQSSLRGRH